MGSPLKTGITTIKRTALSAATRLGREEQAQELLARIREARATLDPVARQHMRSGHAMRVVLASVLRSDSNCIDIGANDGAVLQQFLDLAPAGHHIAYEPLPHLHSRLRERFPSVEVHQIALSSTDGSAEFTHVIDAPAFSGLRLRADLPSSIERTERLQVTTRRLDDTLPDDYVPTLIKIDVEGAELQVMQGALQTLSEHRPFVIFEHGVGGADLYGATPGAVFDLLSDAGMRIFDIEGEGPYSRMRFEATFTEPIWDFLAAPA
ncbi:MAG TPA: FkbM family methyltransferase [Solirubrobacteraceae bacterium]|jgi:FkbM family methyltransferase